MAPPPYSEDFYLTLEVTTSATAEEIKKSFQRLARIRHPDKNGGSKSATALFQKASRSCLGSVTLSSPSSPQQPARRRTNYVTKLNNAYEVLKDPLTRNAYDAQYPLIKATLPRNQNQSGQGESTAQSQDHSSTQETERLTRLKRLKDHEILYLQKLDEADSVVINLLRALTRLKEADDEEMRKKTEENGWWYWMVSVSTRKPQDIEEEKSKREVESLQRTSARRIRELDLLKAKARQAESNERLRMVRMAILVEQRGGPDEIRRQEEAKRRTDVEKRQREVEATTARMKKEEAAREAERQQRELEARMARIRKEMAAREAERRQRDFEATNARMEEEAAREADRASQSTGRPNAAQGYSDYSFWESLLDEDSGHPTRGLKPRVPPIVTIGYERLATPHSLAGEDFRYGAYVFLVNETTAPSPSLLFAWSHPLRDPNTMRLRTLWHVGGISVLVIVALYCLSKALSTLLDDTTPYVLTREELAAPFEGLDSNDTHLIPKIIHQVYLGWDNLPIPPEWEESQQTCIDLHPDFEYKLWNNETARGLLESEYPWFLETWDGYKYHIQRADSIRYFILSRHGGIYIDLDNGCKRHLGPLLSPPAWMPGTTNHMGLTNHIMGASPGHPYFLLLMESLDRYNYDWALPYLTIMNSAGPHFVSMVWDEYLKTAAPEQMVRIISQEDYQGHEFSFFTKTEGGSWYGWDTMAFAWMGHHMPAVAAICFVLICAVASLVWWLAWGLVVVIDSRVRGNQSYDELPFQKSD